MILADLDRVVINLPDRPERLEAFQARWEDFRVQPGVRAETPQLGCMMAHRALSEQVTRDTLVLEDDAVLVRPLVLPDLPADWDMLMLGGQHVHPPVDVAVGLARVRFTVRTHAYVLRASSVPRLLETLDGQPSQTILSQALGAATRLGVLKIYAVVPWQVGQAAGFSDTTDSFVPAETWDL